MSTQRTKIGLVTAVVAGMALSGCVSTDTFNQYVATDDARHNALSARVDGIDNRLNSVGQAAQTAQARADEAYVLAEGKFLMTEVGREEIHFATGKSTLTDEAKATLAALAERLKSENKNVYLEVRGYADMRGGSLTNLNLGRARAQNAARFLADQGVPGAKMQAGSWGEDQPKVAGRSAESYAANRRVEIVIFK